MCPLCNKLIKWLVTKLLWKYKGSMRFRRRLGPYEIILTQYFYRGSGNDQLRNNGLLW